MRFPLPLKFFVFAASIAIAPLAMVGENLVRITRDELKSAANEDLTAVATQLRSEFDNAYRGLWLTPLQVIRNGIDNDELGVAQKVSLLTLGLKELPDVSALQLAVHGSDLPMLVTDQTYSETLQALNFDPVSELATSGDLIASIKATGQHGRPLVSRMAGTNDWIATVALPLQTRIAGREVTLVAKVNMNALGTIVQNHPFRHRGEITVIDQAGRTVLKQESELLLQRDIVSSAMPLIVAGMRADALVPYVRPDGTAMLGAYAFSDWFPWAIITELSERNAYAVVYEMTRRITIVGLIGFSLASLAALFFARRLTNPILSIGRVAERVGDGDFTARVDNVRSKDEIGDLSARINVMAAQLGERLELMKFVSHGTMSAIQEAKQAGMSRGGSRHSVSVLFSDIRGYTEFSESVAPEVVIDMLNMYLEVQSRIVEEHGGDIDKFIGDALVAVFEGDTMEQRAVACAVEIKHSMATLLAQNPKYGLDVGLGIASGEVVMGAMGASDRMDFTVLGSVVNLSARLCGKAAPGEVLGDQATVDANAGLDTVKFDLPPPISLKGYAAPVQAYSAIPQKTPARA